MAGMLLELRRLRRQDDWSRSQIEAHQAQSLQRLREHAYARSTFYRAFHAGCMDRPLQELPVLTKAMLNEHFDAIVAERGVQQAAVAEHVAAVAGGTAGSERFLDRYVVAATSGTTGSPSYVLFGPGEWPKVLATFVRSERYLGSPAGLLRRPKRAIVASTTPWHISARVGAALHSPLLPMLRLDIGQPLAAIVDELNRWQPQKLATYASMAGILAEEQLARRLRITVDRIVSTAEVLSPQVRARVEAAWGKVVFDQYGASEGGTFAAECEAHDGLHVFEDLFILEVVDRHNRPAAAGEWGAKVLLTVLFNQTLPLIRYELTDSLRLATAPCACGNAMLRIMGVGGRQEEVLHFPARAGEGATGSVAVHPMVFYRILDAAPLAGWQVVQEADRLCLRLSRGSREVEGQELAEAVRQAIERQGGEAPAISVEWQEDTARGMTGKARRVVRA
jgi:phenylacetate-coenzyme A ligase PaaK-like adenylate-forming protein